MSDKTTSFDQYARQGTPYPPLEKEKELPQLIEKRKPYKAVERFKSGEKDDRFRIIQANGDFDFYSFSHLIEGSYRSGNLLLSTTTRTFTLSGRNLDQIVDLIADRKAKAICVFDPAKHEPVTDLKEIFIEQILRD